jgi:AcrR family transcriptional regulator
MADEEDGARVSGLKRGSTTEVSIARKEQILDAALNLFYERGYDATSIQDIADAVGLLKGSLYYHIPSKESVLFEIVRRAHDDLLALTDEALNTDAPALERLRTLIGRHCEYVASNTHAVSVFFNEYRALDEAHRKVIVAERDEYEKRIRDLIRQGQDNSEIAKDLTPKVTAMGLLGMVNWIYQWYRNDGTLSGAEIGRQIAELAVRALGPGSVTSRR